MQPQHEHKLLYNLFYTHVSGSQQRAERDTGVTGQFHSTQTQQSKHIAVLLETKLFQPRAYGLSHVIQKTYKEILVILLHVGS